MVTSHQLLHYHRVHAPSFLTWVTVTHPTWLPTSHHLLHSPPPPVCYLHGSQHDPVRVRTQVRSCHSASTGFSSHSDRKPDKFRAYCPLPAQLRRRVCPTPAPASDLCVFYSLPPTSSSCRMLLVPEARNSLLRVFMQKSPSRCLFTWPLFYFIFEVLLI